MKLLAYMKERGLDDAEMAERLGATPRAVRKWKYGETTPRLPEILKIEEVTEGEVRPADFLPSDASSPSTEAA